MNAITPELIASIATRLYNETPGAHLVPKTEADLGNSSESFSIPGAAGLGFHEGSVPNLKAVPGNQAAIPGLPAISPSWPSAPASTPEGFSPPGAATDTADGFSSRGAATDRTDGLSSFVQKIRSGHLRNQDGSCRAGHDPELLQRMFAGKSGTSTGSGTGKGKEADAAQGSPASRTGARPLDIPSIRRDFPALNQKIHGRQLAWLDNGATTQKPQSVIDAISRFYENDNSNIHRGAHTLAARATDAFEQARQKVQSFLGASSSKDIVFVRGTTEGINFIAQTYGRRFLQPGDEIILSTLEHHANIVPWQMIAKEKGAVIRVIPVNDRGEIMLEAYEALLGPRTKLVALTQASNSLGTILPVAEMTRSAKRFNARVLIDGAQSVSHMPVNMQEIGCDFFVFSGHKIFAPTGIGAVYVNEQLHEILPPWHGGGNMIKNVTFEETTYNEAPAKFEAGTPNIADAVGLGAALDYVDRLGLVNTSRYEHELLEYATEQLSRINGVRLLGSAREKVAVISFVVKDCKTEEVGRMLDQEGIAVRAGHHCAQPSLRRFGVDASVRPSFAFYNTFDEIDRLAEAVRRIAQN
jgi:cysteine desulfurase / selenocysteine lyase